MSILPALVLGEAPQPELAIVRAPGVGTSERVWTILPRMSWMWTLDDDVIRVVSIHGYGTDYAKRPTT